MNRNWYFSGVDYLFSFKKWRKFWYMPQHRWGLRTLCQGNKRQILHDIFPIWCSLYSQNHTDKYNGGSQEPGRGTGHYLFTIYRFNSGKWKCVTVLVMVVQPWKEPSALLTPTEVYMQKVLGWWIVCYVYFAMVYKSDCLFTYLTYFMEWWSIAAAQILK